MEYIKREIENVYITRYYPTQNPRMKYKKGDVIHNYDYLNRVIICGNIAHMIEYNYKSFYFIVVSNGNGKRKVIDSFDSFYCNRDEAIDKFLSYCNDKNYKIYMEIR